MTGSGTYSYPIIHSVIHFSFFFYFFFSTFHPFFVQFLSSNSSLHYYSSNTNLSLPLFSMADPFCTCLTKTVQQLKALRRRLRQRKKTKPEGSLLSDSNQLRQVFDFFDANGDGKISPLELRQVLLRLGHDHSAAAAEAQVMVSEMDGDGDGFVNFDDFTKVVSFDDKEGNELESGLVDAFLVFDADRNGFISAGELQRVLVGLGICRRCSLTECREMIKGVDKDGDGFVDFEEFRSMMMMMAA
ncbi:probable calcium-binding protein CML23 [Diospyros lotus]|uniref:probable calcium-binding protein CML23 n=1 Tax=Diospyros lotus TaxID=55363 RepID=UPI0022534F24|nr:probable calcium-binding protein CML23 [Diospyros lotus]